MGGQRLEEVKTYGVRVCSEGKEERMGTKEPRPAAGDGPAGKGFFEIRRQK
jgi:hypothetical protein